MNDFLNGQVENDGFLHLAAASPKIRVADVEAMPRLRWRLFARLPSAAFVRSCCPSLT